MTAIAAERAPSPQSLAAQKAALIVRIHAARGETSNIGRRIATDFLTAEQSRLKLLAGLKLFRAAAVAAGVVWSFKAVTGGSRARRLFTLAVSLMSTMRAVHKVGRFFTPHTITNESHG
ncbi:MAG: hypothetical protein ABL931_13390 [Usitatibacteraceae bacterium]